MFYCKSRMTNAAAHPLGGAQRERESAPQKRDNGAPGRVGAVENCGKMRSGPGEGAVIGLGGWCEAR